MGYLTREEPQPDKSDPAWRKQKAEKSFIMLQMINSMDPAIGKPYLFLLTARQIWEAAGDCYSDLENSSLIYDLKTRLWQFKQGDQYVTNVNSKAIVIYKFGRCWQLCRLGCCY